MDSMAAFPHGKGSRTAGIGVVVGVHVLALIAIGSGLRYVSTPKPPDETTVKIDKAPDLPPPPLPKHVVATAPQWPQPDPIPIPMPDIPIAAAPSPLQTVPIEQAVPRSEGQPFSTGAVAHGEPAIQSVGVACSRTQAPELPVLDWSGDALFRIVAGTTAGRVTEVEVQAVRGGGMDSRAQRKVKSAIERALRDGYVCPGKVRFTQEFEVHVD